MVAFAELALWRKNAIAGQRVPQVLLVLAYTLFFFTTAAVSGLPTDKWMPGMVGSLLVTAIPTFGLVFNGAKKLRAYRSEVARRLRRWMLDKGMGFGLVVMYGVLSRSWMIGAVLGGDSSEYASSLAESASSFDFTLKSIWQFRAAGHPSFAFSFVTAPGLFLVPESPEGIQLIQQVLTLVAMACLYLLLHKLSTLRGVRRQIMSALLAVMVFASPLLWAMDGGFTVDYYAVLFFFMLVYCDAAGLGILSLILALCVGFTKENSWVMLGGYWLFRTVAHIATDAMSAKKAGWRNRLLVAFLHSSSSASLSALAVGFVSLLTIALRGKLWNSAPSNFAVPAAAAVPGTAYNAFGLSMVNISSKLEEVFLMNFSWVVVICIVLIAAYLKKSALSSQHRALEVMRSGEISGDQTTARESIETMAGLVGILMGSVAFNVSFIYASSARYSGVACSALCSLLAILVSRAGDRLSEKRVAAVPVFLISLFSAQAFASVDPVSNALFRTVSVGSATILNTAQSSYETPMGYDYFMANLQYLWRSKAIERMLADSSFSSGDIVLMPGNTYQESLVSEYLGEPAGREKPVRSGGEPRKLKTWDAAAKSYRNVLSEGRDKGLPTRSVAGLHGWTLEFDNLANVDSDAAASEFLKELGVAKVVVYFDPIVGVDEDTQMAYLRQFFNVGERHVASYMGWDIPYYVMVTKLSVPESVGGKDVQQEANSIASADLLDEVKAEAGTVELVDPGTVRRGGEITDAQVTSKLIELVSDKRVYLGTNVPPAVKMGDLVYCRLRVFVNGVWDRNPQSPDGFYTKGLTAGSDAYLGGLGESLVGKKAGDIFTLDCTLGEEYDQLVEGLGAGNVTIEVVVTKIAWTLPTTFEDVCVETLGLSYEDCRAYVFSLLEHAGVSEEDVYDYVASSSSFTVPDTLLKEHAGDLDEAYEKKASALGVTLDEFKKGWLDMDGSSYERLAKEYALITSKRQIVKEQYARLGVSVGTAL